MTHLERVALEQLERLSDAAFEGPRSWPSDPDARTAESTLIRETAAANAVGRATTP